MNSPPSTPEEAFSASLATEYREPVMDSGPDAFTEEFGYLNEKLLAMKAEANRISGLLRDARRKSGK